MADVKNVVTLGIGAAPGGIKWFIVSGIGFVTVIPPTPPTPVLPTVEEGCFDDWGIDGEGSDIPVAVPALMHLEAIPAMSESNLERNQPLPVTQPAEPDLTGTHASEWELR